MEQYSFSLPDLKKFCTDFYFWWHNSKGTNTYQGFDEWIKTQAAPFPAKEEQEGPFPVYDLSHLSEEDKNKFAGEVMKSASESLMATFYSLGLQSHLDQMSINDSNGDKFILAFRKIVDDKLLGPPLPMASSKKEHEGPWKSVVHSSVSDTEAGREYADHVTITDGRVELYFDGGIDDNDEQLLCNLLNERKIKLDYDHEPELYASQMEVLYKEARTEVEELRKREQNGLRWLPINDKVDGWQLCRLKGTINQFPLMITPNVIVDFAGKSYKRDELEYVGESTTPPVKVDYEKKYKEANQFIIDLAKELGQEGLGYDDLSWTIEDFMVAARTKFEAPVKEEFTGSVFSQPAPGITLGCISPEARDLLDTIMAAWELHYAGLQKNAPHVEITFYGFAYWLVRWSGLIQPATSAIVKEAEQPTEIISREEDLIYRIVEQWGNAMCSMDEKVQWLKDYAAESRQQPAGESAVWVKGHYDQLYEQVKRGTRTVCYVDYFWNRNDKSDPMRDICTIKPETWEFGSRGIGYGGAKYMKGDEKENFIQLCQSMNIEWLDESGLASSRDIAAILTSIHNSDSFFRLENDEDGYCLSIIDRGQYPRIWADKFQEGKTAIIAESVDNIVNRSVLSEKDWKDRFEGKTLEECIKDYLQSTSKK